MIQLQHVPVYLVIGSSKNEGEWIVVGYFDREEAEAHADEANARARQLHNQYEGEPIPSGANEFDPSPYVASNYLVTEVCIH